MSYKQVKYYQELGDYETAYRIAREEGAANPSLKWPRNTTAWLLIRMMKMNARIYGKNKFMRQLDEFKTLGIPPEDEKLWGTVAWPLRDIIEDSLRMQWFTAEFGDEIFAAIKDMPFTKPSDSYTALVLSFAKLGALWPRLAEFIEWWGLDNFTDFDYRKYPEHGKLVSAVEKVQEAYRLSIIRNTK